MFKVVKFLLISILSVIFLFIFIIIRLYAIKIYDTNAQITNLQNMKNIYDNANYESLDESEFTNIDLTDDQIKLNEIKMLATHNSYKKTAVPLGRLFVSLGTGSSEEGRALKYGYQSISDQLHLGVRSMEFDLRLRKTEFQLTHVPLVDNSSVAPNFSLALEEISLFSDNNPNHVPIIILMEIKDDWMILDHALQKMDKEDLIDLDNLLKDKLGNKLYQPKDLIENDKTLKETIQTTGWPSINSLLGKVIFVLHPGSFTNSYYEIDESLMTQAMFIGSYYQDTNKDYASFFVHNELNVERINELVDQNFIVRTRIDSELNYSDENFQLALETNAQILTSDFLVGRSDLDESEIIYFFSNYMIIKKDDE
jgi:hypothetical protein